MTHQAIAALSHLLRLVIGRGRVQSSNNAGPLLVTQLKLSPKETPDIPTIGHFGFSSWVMNGADVVCVFVGGDRSNGIGIASHDLNHKFTLAEPGESAIFNAHGLSVWLTKDDGIVIEAGGKPVTINNASDVTVNASGLVKLAAPSVQITGNLQVDGNIHANGTIGDSVRTIEQDRAIYDSHTHPVNGAVTGPPNQLE